MILRDCLNFVPLRFYSTSLRGLVQVLMVLGTAEASSCFKVRSEIQLSIQERGGTTE